MVVIAVVALVGQGPCVPSGVHDQRVELRSDSLAAQLLLHASDQEACTREQAVNYSAVTR